MKLALLGPAGGSWVRASIEAKLSPESELSSLTVIAWMPAVVEEVTVSPATPLESVVTDGCARAASPAWPSVWKVTGSPTTGAPVPSTTSTLAVVVLLPLAGMWVMLSAAVVNLVPRSFSVAVPATLPKPSVAVTVTAPAVVEDCITVEALPVASVVTVPGLKLTRPPGATERVTESPATGWPPASVTTTTTGVWVAPVARRVWL